MNQIVPPVEDSFEAERRFVSAHLFDNVPQLALSLKKHGGLNREWILRQIAARQILQKKVPLWVTCDDLCFPDSLPLEQCSSQATAEYKQQCIRPHLDSFDLGIDLTGGLGIDCYWLSKDFKCYHYVERQEYLCRLAQHNFQALGRSQVEVQQKEAIDYLSQCKSADFIYLDPARRNQQGKKMVALNDCDPDVGSLHNQLLEKAPVVMVKLSPMLDISLALQQLPRTAEVHIVAVDNECKELLFMLRRDASVEDVCLYTANLRCREASQRFSFRLKEERSAGCSYAESLENYLYEPNAAVMKSGGFACLGKSYSLKKLHPNSHLFTSATLQPSFPGRIFTVADVLSPSDKRNKARLKGAALNVCVRNYPEPAELIRSRFRIKEGKERFLFATTLLRGEHRFIICDKLSYSAPNSIK